MGLKSSLSNVLVNSLSDKTVISGPFQGLKYTSSSIGSTYPPKILGTYELELQPVIEGMIEQLPSLIVDVGAAEGYYAIGLAKRLPDSKIIAFEAVPEGRNLLSQMAEKNQVEKQLQIEAECSLSTLETALGDAVTRDHHNCWVIMDIEGGEIDLLDPEKVPGLRQANVLVEIHDHMAPGAGDTIKQRFNESHDLEVVYERPRSLDDFPVPVSGRLTLWPKLIIEKAMDEKRSVIMHWFVLTPRKN